MSITSPRASSCGSAQNRKSWVPSLRRFDPPVTSSVEESGPQRSVQTLALNIHTSSEPTMQNGSAFLVTRRCGTAALLVIGGPQLSVGVDRDFAGLFDPHRCVKDFDRHDIAGGVVVEDHPRFILIALGDGDVAEHDSQGISLSVVIYFHALLQYFSIFLVRYTVTTVSAVGATSTTTRTR